MRERLKNIQCWKCKNTFDFTADLSEGGPIRTFCGICDEENVLDLEPYRSKEETILRSTDDSQSGDDNELTLIHYQFPETLIGKRPTEDKPASD